MFSGGMTEISAFQKKNKKIGSRSARGNNTDAKECIGKPPVLLRRLFQTSDAISNIRGYPASRYFKDRDQYLEVANLTT